MNRQLLCGAAALVAGMLVSPWARATDYYFSPSGNDANKGTSLSAPFASIAKLNSLDLNPGDNVLFQGGASFNGNVNLAAHDSGASGSPIRISTYGSGRATINAGSGTGIYALNAGNLEISNLNVVGAGSRYDSAAGKWVFNNTGNGIQFQNNLDGNVRLNNIKVNNVAASGFGQNGIFVGAAKGTAGYNGIRITNVTANDNQLAGVQTMGDYNNSNRNSFSDVYVARVKAYNNFGEDKQPTKGNSGNGILLGQVTGGVIEQSVAHHNGLRCASTQGGAVGIWAWDSANIVIQRNESYENGTAGKHDGGGFDLDGGVINSVIQYNYSHDNQGAGYLLAEYYGAKPFKGNTVRFNISQDDGRKNGYGAIHAFGTVTDTKIYNNTIYLSPVPSSSLRDDGPPAAVKFRNWTGNDLEFFNNLFMLEDDKDSTTADPIMLAVTDGSGLTFKRNAYWDGGVTGKFNTRDLLALYLDAKNAPDLVGPLGEGPTLDDAAKLNSVIQYALQNGSPLIDTGLDLTDLGIDPGQVDFFGKSIGSLADIGAAAGNASMPIPEPASLGLVLGAGLLLGRRRR